MNRINPLYIGILLLVILIFLAFKLNSVREERLEVTKEYKETQKIAVRLSELKEIYQNKEMVQRTLKRILRQPSLLSAKIKQDIKSTGITIISNKIDLNTLNFLMSKLLNGLYNIKQVKIKKLSSKNATLLVEITW